MAAPIGQPSTQLPDGTWVGMTPAGIRQAIGQQYMNEGIIPGPTSSTKVKGTTGWSYSVPALAAVAYTDAINKHAVIIPVDEGTVSVAAPVGGAARTDTIYVGTDGVTRVATGTGTAPGGSVVLGVMNIPASATNTQGAVDSHDRVYAVPAGASLGRRVHWEAPAGKISLAVGSEKQVHTARFTVPTDRLVRVDMTITLSGTGTSGMAGYTVVLDGADFRSLSCDYSSSTGWSTHSGTWTAELTAGPHTVEVVCRNNAGTGWTLATGSSTSEVNIWDAGVAV